jgi:hypothetical protein
MNKELLLSKVITIGSCWIWKGCKRGRTGYGCAKHNGRVIDVHRISWMLFKGPIPNGLLVCHKCDVKLCVNPKHLFIGTYQDNSIDAMRKGRITVPIGRRFEKGYFPHNRSLSIEIVKKIKSAILQDILSLKQISELFNVKYQTVRDINRKSKRLYIK